MGNLIYLSHTRPNIAFSISMVSHFMHKPRGRAFRNYVQNPNYPKKTLSRGLLFKKKN